MHRIACGLFALACFSCDASSDSMLSDGDASSTIDGSGPLSPSDASVSDLLDSIDLSGPPPRADIPGLPCMDAITDVYVTPMLPPLTPAALGDVFRCAHDVDLALADVEKEISGKGIKTQATSGTSIYRVAFRTTRGDGSAGASTARVYLPTTPVALPLPVIVIGHPTDGISDTCTPSEDPTSNEDLALPWAALGYAAIVPDYAGLGNEGTQSYLDNHDQAFTILDGARALRKLMATGVFSSQVLAVGYSQGGGAVLSAQALEKSYGDDGKLAAVITFAPEWATRMNSFGYVDQLKNPTELTIETGISENVVTVMREYGYYANTLGLSDAGDAFPASSRAGIANAVNTLCQTPLGGYLQATAVHVGDIFDPTFRTNLLACIQSSGQTCVEPELDFYNYLQANFVASDPAGAPVLFIQGLLDVIMPPASEAACNIDKMTTDGLIPQVCTDSGGQHTTVVGRNMDFALTWGLSVLAGKGAPSCSEAGLPTCTP